MAAPAARPEPPRHPRLRREARTLEAMVDICCAVRHGAPGGRRCEACAEFLDYALLRLARCPFQEGKTTCANCRVHCYRPDMRERARETMRTAGPRMPLRHPVMTLRHFLDGWRKEPLKRK
jgi:hypothetical protein